MKKFVSPSDNSKLEGRFCDLPDKGDGLDSSMDEDNNKLAYSVTDVPPWYLCILLGTQVWQQISLFFISKLIKVVS